MICEGRLEAGEPHSSSGKTVQTGWFAELKAEYGYSQTPQVSPLPADSSEHEPVLAYGSIFPLFSRSLTVQNY
jgi:hypothetical protein